MCIILGEVRSVSQTKLFVLANQDKTRQLTFYSNAVNTPEENMMILPVPNGNDTIQLHKIQYRKIFEDLNRSVQKTYREPSSNLYTRSLAYASADRKPLEIISHGSYLVSIASQLDDLLRLDESVFDFPPELYNFFRKHYSSEFSYICCILKPGLEAYEPLCYSHPLHSSGKLFVPTLHYHNHHGKVETDDADWDHLIYSVGTEEKANRGYTSNYYNNISWKHFPEEYQKLNVSSVRCAEIRGHSKNTDIAFALW